MDKNRYEELFISEAREILDHLNNSLVALEKNPGDPESLQEIFRQVHTFKGNAASMGCEGGYEEMTKIAHEMEGVLERMRQGKQKADRPTLDRLFRSRDRLESLLSTREVPTVRVAADRLDHLMNIVGELVTQKIRLEEIGKNLGEKTLQETLAQVGRLIGELQLETMEVRLVPIDPIFNRFPRMVRDLAAEQGKKVDLAIAGGEIGLDRTILDEINEPLIHLIRNAVTHGIEPPEERKRVGKKETGTIRLSARRESHFALIEVADDGRGIDLQEIRRTAVAKGIVSGEEAKNLSEEQALMLITGPGFSTSRVVSEAAGRGIGMNSVKTKVESLGGSLKIESRPKQGSAFQLKLPLTMAVVQALLVKIAEETFAIPLVNVLETLKIKDSSIRRVESEEMIPYRESVLPLVRVREKFGFGPSAGNGEKAQVVVVEIGHRKAGLVVDQLLSQQEVVIKSTTGLMKNVRGVAGATILGSGKVAMILDMPAVI
jgi:two-component system chemotaxis sensor kinase CheA